MSPRRAQGVGQDSARKGLRNAFDAIQRVQLGLCELSRDRVRQAGWQHRDARREAQGCAVRDLSRSRFTSYREPEGCHPRCSAETGNVRGLPSSAACPSFDGAEKMNAILGSGHGLQVCLSSSAGQGDQQLTEVSCRKLFHGGRTQIQFSKPRRFR